MANLACTVSGLFLSAVITTISCLRIGQQYNTIRSPFTPGQYSTKSFVVDPNVDKSPLHSIVFYPEARETFIPIFFIGGLYGHVLSEDYGTFLAEVASHGYMVFGMDPNSPLIDVDNSDGLKDKKLDLYLNQMKWLADNIRSRNNSTPDWTRPVLMCQSAGCDDTLLIMNVNKSIAKASVFIDPVSVHSLDMKSLSSKIAALTYMSELSEFFPDCCIPGMDWKKIYSLMTCVKVRMEVKDFGHCDLLDYSSWKTCHDTKVCRTTNDSRLPDYRDFTTGIIVAFIQWTVSGIQDMAKFVIDPSLMPLALKDLAFNTTCLN